MKELSHIDPEGRASMVDVAGKGTTRREAVARGRVTMTAATLELVERRALPKGDVFATARVAGILAAKATPSLVPLTHPVELTFIGIDFEVDRDRPGIVIVATVRCEAKTGVEIEAMTACAVAALTIYDMCKSAEKGIVIEAVALEKKSGGTSGDWTRS